MKPASLLLVISLLLQPHLASSQETAATLPHQQYPAFQLRSSGEILHALQRLNTVASVLYIAAHPDDENTRMISWLVNEKKVRTGYLSLTRGDGGQNLIGNEKGEELGLLRTQELLEARRTDGGEQFFTRARDFGYSKTPEETFEIWGKERILRDVVWVIRKFRPDVIIMRFPTTGEGGHGHHTASAILAVEAFKLAADPKAFPDQLRYFEPWQSRRILWNTFSWNRKPGEILPGEIPVETGGFNPLLGVNYGELAALARSKHRCQGFGSRLLRGSVTEYVKNVAGDSITSDIFEDVPMLWSETAGGKPVSDLIESIIAEFDPLHPDKSLPALIHLREMLTSGPPSPLVSRKISEINDLILACAGIYAEASTTASLVIPGQEFDINWEVISRTGTQPAVIRKVTALSAADSLQDVSMSNNKLYAGTLRLRLPADHPLSQPHWLAGPGDIGTYNTDAYATDLPGNPPAVSLSIILELMGKPFRLDIPVMHKVIDPSEGEVFQPLVVSPPVIADMPETARIFPGSNPQQVRFNIRSFGNDSVAKIRINVPQGWKTNWSEKELTGLQKGENRTLDVIVTPPSGNRDETGMLSAEIWTGDKKWSTGKRDVSYPHIYRQTWFPSARVQLRKVNMQPVSGLVGYIPGAGDDVPEALAQAGYTVEILTDEKIATTDLSRYKAIVSGIRAFNVNPGLGLFHSKLMDYVSGGGNYIVQYNTNNFTGSVTVPVGPAPFTLGRDRVTLETAPVTLNDPSLEIFHFPNKISSADFEGWVQERGLYFVSKYDSIYTPLFTMNDPGEKPANGAAVLARHGKGLFIYTGLSFFRQLPEGVPGALRLLINFIEQPPAKS